MSFLVDEVLPGTQLPPSRGQHKAGTAQALSCTPAWRPGPRILCPDGGGEKHCRHLDLFHFFPFSSLESQIRAQCPGV